MGIAYQIGQQLTQDDLFVLVIQSSLSGNMPADPFLIIYNVFDKTTGTPLLIPPIDRPAAKAETGRFFAPDIIPRNSNFGEFEVRFSWQLDDGGPFTQQMIRFHIVASFTILNNTALKNLVNNASSGSISIPGGGILFPSGDTTFVVLGEGNTIPLTKFFF